MSKKLTEDEILHRLYTKYDNRYSYEIEDIKNLLMDIQTEIIFVENVK